MFKLPAVKDSRVREVLAFDANRVNKLEVDCSGVLKNLGPLGVIFSDKRGGGISSIDLPLEFLPIRKYFRAVFNRMPKVISRFALLRVYKTWVTLLFQPLN